MMPEPIECLTQQRLGLRQLSLSFEQQSEIVDQCQSDGMGIAQLILLLIKCLLKQGLCLGQLALILEQWWELPNWSLNILIASLVKGSA